MNVLFILYLLSGITISKYLNKKKRFVANTIYLLSYSIVLLLYLFMSDDKIFSFIAKMLTPTNTYYFIKLTLNNIEYIFMYLFYISIVTIIQLFISLYLICKKIEDYRYKNANGDITFKYKKYIEIFVKKTKDKYLSVDKVFINYCRIIN